MGLGLLLAAVGPLCMLGAVWASNDGRREGFGLVDCRVFDLPITLGELCLSRWGSHWSTRRAGPNSALMMGGWFLATAVGAKMSGILREQYSNPHLSHKVFWSALVGCNAFFGVVLLLLCAG